MPAEPALHGDPRRRACFVLDDGTPRDVFDVLGSRTTSPGSRSALLSKIGEELASRIEQDGAVTDAVAPVRAHVGPRMLVTELEISERSEPRTS